MIQALAIVGFGRSSYEDFRSIVATLLQGSITTSLPHKKRVKK